MASEVEISRLIVRLQGDIDQYRGAMEEAQRLTAHSAGEIGRQVEMMKLAFVGAMTAVGGLSLKAFADFDSAMTQSTAIMSVTEAQTEAMREQALSLGSSGLVGPTELAKSYFFLASAGKSAEQSMALLPQVAEFATAGAFDMAQATDLLTDAQSALGMSSKIAAEDAENMGRLSNVLVRANTLANASVQQFSEALINDAAASMKTFNIEVEEGMAVLAAMADQGNKGLAAGSEFARMLRLMTNAARENADVFKRYNVTVFDSEGGLRNLADIIADLERALGPMSTQMKGAALEQLGFTALTQKAILPLLGTSEAIRRYERELRMAGSTTSDVAGSQMTSLSSQMMVLKNQITVVMIEIGQRLSPAMREWNDLMSFGVRIWGRLDEGVKTAVVAVAAATTALTAMSLVLPRVAAGLAACASSGKAFAASIVTNPLVLWTTAAAGAAYAGHKLAMEISGINDVMKEMDATIARNSMLTEQNRGHLNDKVMADVKEIQKIEDKHARLAALNNLMAQVGAENNRRVLEQERLKADIGRERDKEFTAGQSFGAGISGLMVGGPFGGVAAAITSRVAPGFLRETLADWDESFAPGLKRARAAVKDSQGDIIAFNQAVRKIKEAIAEANAPSGMPSLAAGMEAVGSVTESLTRRFQPLRDMAAGVQKEMSRLGESVTKEFATPEENFAARMELLNGLLAGGAIGMATYERATAAAREQLGGTAVEAEKAVRGLQTVEAVAFGSAEALHRVNAFRASVSSKATQSPEVKVGKDQLAVQKGMLKSLQNIEKKEGAGLAPANLGGAA